MLEEMEIRVFLKLCWNSEMQIVLGKREREGGEGRRERERGRDKHTHTHTHRVH